MLATHSVFLHRIVQKGCNSNRSSYITRIQFESKVHRVKIKIINFLALVQNI